MRYEVSQRPANNVEAAFIRRRFGIGLERFIGNLAIPMIPAGGGFLVVMLVGFGALTVVRGKDLTGGEIVWTLLLAFAVGFAVWVRMFVEFRPQRLRVRNDLRMRVVEVIHAEDVRLAQQEEYNDEGPLYYFGIGNDKVLFLGGQWLYGWDVYSVTPPENEGDDDPGPQFPASSFTVTRLPLSGEVLRIDIEGPPLRPEVMVGRLGKATLPRWIGDCRQRLGESCLMDGSFEEIARLK